MSSSSVLPLIIDDIKPKFKKWYHVLILYLVLGILFSGYLNNLSEAGRNLSYLYFTITFLTTLFRPSWGTLLTIACLPILPSLHNQINQLGNLNLLAFDYPGFDLLGGLFFGQSLRNFVLRRKNPETNLPSLIYIGHFYIIASVSLAITRTLWQSGSYFTLRGLLLNLLEIRFLGWQDDFFPLLDALAYSSVFLGFIEIHCQLRQKTLRPIQIVAAFTTSAFLVCFYAIMQKYFDIGWIKSGTEPNSTFRDLHSFAGYLLLPAVGSFFFYSQCLGNYQKFILFTTQVLAAYCIYLSGSRFTFVSLFPLAAVSLVFAIPKGKRLWGVVPLFAIVGFGLVFIEKFGFRGITISSILDTLRNRSFEQINQVLSYRPEIFKEAIRFIREFPIFGLGQGEFNRTGSLPEWGLSSYLLSSGGENAHNYFLQTLAELGFIGFVIIWLIFILPLRRRNNQKSLANTWIGILSIMCFGNVYSHSFLEREILLLFSVVFSCYYHASFSNRPNPKTLEPSITGNLGKYLITVILAIILALGVREIYASFHHLPFQKNLICYRFHSQWQDKWVSGHFIYEFPTQAKGIYLDGHVGQPDVKDRPLKVKFLVKDSNGNALHTEERVVSSPGPLSFSFQEIDKIEQKLILEIHTSHCFVPRNYGLNSDRRHLGVVIEKIEPLF